MNSKILLIMVCAAVFTGCNTAYKSGQTPDDVYYSPARVIEENHQRETTKETDQTKEEDWQLRMKIRDRRWRDLNNEYSCNCSYDYHPYKYGYGYGYYYNPNYYPYPVYLPSVKYSNPKNTTARIVNLGSYEMITTDKIQNPKTGRNESVTRKRTYNNSNTRTERETRTIPVDRTYSPTTSGSSSGGSRPSTGQSIPRPSRGN